MKTFLRLFIGTLAFCHIGTLAFAQMTPDTIVDIPMRDTTTLKADVFIPSGCDSCPTILVMTPYSRIPFRSALPLGVGQNLDAYPYSWVVVDWRGFYGSAPAAKQGSSNGEDGYDVIDWIKDQPWNNGRVGTWGPSALGGVQYVTMKEKHPNHTCAVPLVAHPYQGYDNYFYGGVLERARLNSLDSLGFGLGTLVLSNPYLNILWQFAATNSWYASDITIPTLQIGGWYDHNIDIMMDWHVETRLNAAPAVRDQQYLLVGPWVHGGTGPAYVGSSNQGELSYPNAAGDSDSMALDFFAYYLLDSNNGWDQSPTTHFYKMGVDEWDTTSAAQLEVTHLDSLYLNEGGGLSGSNGIDSSSFVSDPANPSPTIGGQTLSQSLDQGPYDQASLDSRSDILTFTSGSLSNNVEISGRVLVKLFVSCDRPDADLSIRLVDVYPDGRSMLINDGIHRMRFRDEVYTKASESFMTPGNIYEVTVRLPFVHYTWLAGHKIKIYVGGNSAIRWDVNLQNGDSMYVAGDTNVANIAVHHSTTYPSKIYLPGYNQNVSREKLESNGLKVFPNPANDLLEFDASGHVESAVVLDIHGSEILRIPPQASRIQVQSLTAGTYILEVRTTSGTYRTKFLKQ